MHYFRPILRVAHDASFLVFSLAAWLAKVVTRRSGQSHLPAALHDEHTTPNNGSSVDGPVACCPQYWLQAEGTFLVTIVIQPLPNDVVSAMLPPELELGTHDIAPEGQHPVLFMFGFQKDVHPNYQSFGAMNYAEFILALPHIQVRDTSLPYRRPFIFMPRLFLNKWFPIFLGLFYGFAKKYARTTIGTGEYRVDTSEGQPIISLETTPQGKPGGPDDFPHFPPVGQLFGEPFVGRDVLGSLVCSCFDFKIPQSVIQACQAHVNVHESFVPGIPTGQFTKPGIDEAPLGAFHIRLPWTLTPPFSCSRLKDS